MIPSRPQKSTQGAFPLFLVYSKRTNSRLGPKDNPAFPPLRTANRTLSGSACSLLPPRLSSTAPNLSPVLGGGGPLLSMRDLDPVDMMNQAPFKNAPCGPKTSPPGLWDEAFGCLLRVQK